MNLKIEKALNQQINAEMFSAYLYLSMATYFDANGLPGFANWMKVQSQEEMFHALKFYDYVFERGGRVILDLIEKPKTDFASPLSIFKEVLAHEKKVTKLINNLYELALKEKDYAFQSYLGWFIDEQVEEEATASAMVDKLKLAGDKSAGMFMLDSELVQRTFTPPAK